MEMEELPPYIKEKITRLDQIQRTLSAVLAQKQEVDGQLFEVTRALETISKLPEDAEIYKSIGAYLVKTTKSEAQKELEEKKQLFRARKEIVERQEKKLREDFMTLQKEVSDYLSKRAERKG